MTSTPETNSVPPPTRGADAPPGAPPGPNRVSPFSWWMLALLMAWNLWLFFPRHIEEVSLPYSDFITQVAAHNVTKVRIVGEAISGSFARAVTWPQPATAE